MGQCQCWFKLIDIDLKIDLLHVRGKGAGGNGAKEKFFTTGSALASALG